MLRIENEQVISHALRDFMLACEAKLLSPHTMEFYDHMVSPFIEWLGTKDLSAQEIRAYLVHRSKQVSPGTVHAHARSIRVFVRFMYREGWIENELVVDMPRVEQKPVNVLSIKEIERVIDACLKPRDKALILTMLDTGVRRGEIVSLRWDDVEFHDGTLLIRRSKSKRVRIVPIGVKARRALLAWKRSCRTSRVFELKVSGLRMALWRIGQRADVKFSAHDLRRTAATMMLREGASAFHVKEMLGHRSLITTQRYIALAGADLVAAHKQYGLVDRL